MIVCILGWTAFHTKPLPKSNAKWPEMNDNLIFHFHFQVWTALVGEEGLFQLSYSQGLRKFAWPTNESAHDVAWHNHPPHRWGGWATPPLVRVALSHTCPCSGSSLNDDLELMKRGNAEHQRQRSYFKLNILQHQEYFKSHAIMYFYR